MPLAVLYFDICTRPNVADIRSCRGARIQTMTKHAGED